MADGDPAACRTRRFDRLELDQTTTELRTESGSGASSSTGSMSPMTATWLPKIRDWHLPHFSLTKTNRPADKWLTDGIGA